MGPEIEIGLWCSVWYVGYSIMAWKRNQRLVQYFHNSSSFAVFLYLKWNYHCNYWSNQNNKLRVTTIWSRNKEKEWGHLHTQGWIDRILLNHLWGQLAYGVERFTYNTNSYEKFDVGNNGNKVVIMAIRVWGLIKCWSNDKARQRQ